MSVENLGWELWLLLGCTALCFAVIAERVWFFFRTTEDFDSLKAQMQSTLRSHDMAVTREVMKGDGMICNVIRAGLDAVDAGAKHSGPIEQALTGQLKGEEARHGQRLHALLIVACLTGLVTAMGTVLICLKNLNTQPIFLEPEHADTVGKIVGAGEPFMFLGLGVLLIIPSVVTFLALRGSIIRRTLESEAMARLFLAGLN
ncbi:MAG: hypothetical protein CMH54_03430 [Myxococcales bacterium]|nr:hypothetical protein [Myxococcales bacterium]